MFLGTDGPDLQDVYMCCVVCFDMFFNQFTVIAKVYQFKDSTWMSFWKCW